jgi:hypothetical protein
MDRKSIASALIHLLLIEWIVLVYGIHCWIYDGPRVMRFLQQWGR